MVNYTKKAIKGVIIVFVMSILASIFGYFLRLILARTLTIEEFGLIYSIIYFFGFFSIFQNLGLAEALAKYIAEFKVKNQFSEIKNSIIIAFLSQLLSSIVIGLIFIIFSQFLSVNYFHYPDASLLIKIYAIAVILYPTTGIFSSIFRGFQHMKYYSLIDFSWILFIFTATFILLNLGFGILSPFIAYLLVNILPVIFYFPLFIKKTFPDFFEIKFRFDKILTKKLFLFGIPVMLSGFAGVIFSYTDTIMITYFRSLKEVGLYNVGMPTAQILSRVALALVVVLLPISSELWAKKNFKKLKIGIELLYKYSFILVLPLSLLMFLFPEIILNVLFGESYLEAADVLRILSIGTIVFTIAQINNSILSGIGKPKIVSKIMLVSACFNAVLNFFLIPMIGIVGAAIATFISFF